MASLPASDLICLTSSSAPSFGVIACVRDSHFGATAGEVEGDGHAYASRSSGHNGTTGAVISNSLGASAPAYTLPSRVRGFDSGAVVVML